MSKERIRQRLNEFERSEQEIERRARIEKKAYDAAGGMFNALQKQAQEDVEDSNREFARHSIRCDWKSIPSGFEVIRMKPAGLWSLRCTRERSSLFIHYELFLQTDRALGPVLQEQGEIEIKPNFEDGEIEYEHEQQRFRDPDEVVAINLDGILPGANG